MYRGGDRAEGRTLTRECLGLYSSASWIIYVTQGEAPSSISGADFGNGGSEKSEKSEKSDDELPSSRIGKSIRGAHTSWFLKKHCSQRSGPLAHLSLEAPNTSRYEVSLTIKILIIFYFGMNTKGLSSGLTIEQLRASIDCQIIDFPSIRESDTLSISMSVSM